MTKMYPRGNHWAVGKCPERRLPAPGLGDPDPVSSRFWSPAWRGCAASLSSFNPRSARSSKLPSPPFHPVSPRSEGPSPVFLLLSRASAARTKEPRFLPTLPPWSPPFCSPPDGKPVWSTRHYVTPGQLWGATFLSSLKRANPPAPCEATGVGKLRPPEPSEPACQGCPKAGFQSFRDPLQRFSPLQPPATPLPESHPAHLAPQELRSPPPKQIPPLCLLFPLLSLALSLPPQTCPHPSLPGGS